MNFHQFKIKSKEKMTKETLCRGDAFSLVSLGTNQYFGPLNFQSFNRANEKVFSGNVRFIFDEYNQCFLFSWSVESEANMFNYKNVEAFMHCAKEEFVDWRKLKNFIDKLSQDIGIPLEIS